MLIVTRIQTRDSHWASAVVGVRGTVGRHVMAAAKPHVRASCGVLWSLEGQLQICRQRLRRFKSVPAHHTRWQVQAYLDAKLAAVVAVLVVVGVLVWAGTTLIIGCRQIRRLDRRPYLSKRPLPGQPSSIADEAVAWLEKQ